MHAGEWGAISPPTLSLINRTQRAQFSCARLTQFAVPPCLGAFFIFRQRRVTSAQQVP